MRYRFILILLLALFASCRPVKKQTAEAYTLTAIATEDTTSVSVESQRDTATATDKTHAEATEDTELSIEFTDSGGSLVKDYTGKIHVAGVKSIKLRCNTSSLSDEEHERQVAKIRDALSAVSSERKDSVGSTQTRSVAIDPKATLPLWVKTVIALCCIAFLLWRLFLYRMRKGS